MDIVHQPHGLQPTISTSTKSTNTTSSDERRIPRKIVKPRTEKSNPDLRKALRRSQTDLLSLAGFGFQEKDSSSNTGSGGHLNCFRQSMPEDHPVLAMRPRRKSLVSRVKSIVVDEDKKDNHESRSKSRPRYDTADNSFSSADQDVLEIPDMYPKSGMDKRRSSMGLGLGWRRPRSKLNLLNTDLPGLEGSEQTFAEIRERAQRDHSAWRDMEDAIASPISPIEESHASKLARRRSRLTPGVATRLGHDILRRHDQLQDYEALPPEISPLAFLASLEPRSTTTGDERAATPVDTDYGRIGTFSQLMVMNRTDSPVPSLLSQMRPLPPITTTRDQYIDVSPVSSRAPSPAPYESQEEGRPSNNGSDVLRNSRPQSYPTGAEPSDRLSEAGHTVFSLMATSPPRSIARKPVPMRTPSLIADQFPDPTTSFRYEDSQIEKSDFEVGTPRSTQDMANEYISEIEDSPYSSRCDLAVPNTPLNGHNFGISPVQSDNEFFEVEDLAELRPPSPPFARDMTSLPVQNHGTSPTVEVNSDIPPPVPAKSPVRSSFHARRQSAASPVVSAEPTPWESQMRGREPYSRDSLPRPEIAPRPSETLLPSTTLQKAKSIEILGAPTIPERPLLQTRATDLADVVLTAAGTATKPAIETVNNKPVMAGRKLQKNRPVSLPVSPVDLTVRSPTNGAANRQYLSTPSPTAEKRRSGGFFSKKKGSKDELSSPAINANLPEIPDAMIERVSKRNSTPARPVSTERPRAGRMSAILEPQDKVSTPTKRDRQSPLRRSSPMPVLQEIQPPNAAPPATTNISTLPPKELVKSPQTKGRKSPPTTANSEKENRPRRKSGSFKPHREKPPDKYDELEAEESFEAPHDDNDIIHALGASPYDVVKQQQIQTKQSPWEQFAFDLKPSPPPRDATRGQTYPLAHHHQNQTGPLRPQPWPLNQQVSRRPLPTAPASTQQMANYHQPTNNIQPANGYYYSQSQQKPMIVRGTPGPYNVTSRTTSSSTGLTVSSSTTTSVVMKDGRSYTETYHTTGPAGNSQPSPFNFPSHGWSQNYSNGPAQPSQRQVVSPDGQNKVMNLVGRYEGGLGYNYAPGYGIAGSAGTGVNGSDGSCCSNSRAQRKGVALSQGFGVDLSDVPIFVTANAARG